MAVNCRFKIYLRVVDFIMYKEQMSSGVAFLILIVQHPVKVSLLFNVVGAEE